MSTRQDYSELEWQAITSGPLAAGMLIALSDASGPIGIAKEAMAVGKAIADSATGEAPEVVKSLAESAKTWGGRPTMPHIPRGDREQAKNALIGAINAAVDAVEEKSPAEAEGYKAWLASVAVRVAHASKEGGNFLGVGGTPVSAEEQAAVEQLAALLNVSSPQIGSHS
jgi:hypothetical protein